MSDTYAFVAIYTGDTIATARLIAASADPSLVQYVATRLLDHGSESDDPATAAVDLGRRNALRLIVEQEDANV